MLKRLPIYKSTGQHVNIRTKPENYTGDLRTRWGDWVFFPKHTVMTFETSCAILTPTCTVIWITYSVCTVKTFRCTSWSVFSIRTPCNFFVPWERNHCHQSFQNANVSVMILNYLICMLLHMNHLIWQLYVLLTQSSSFLFQTRECLLIKQARQDSKYLLFLPVKPFLETRCVYFTTVCTEFVVTPLVRI